MLLKNDDGLYRVDARWLGPRGMQLPWAARYSAYGVGFLLFLAGIEVVHKIGVGLSPVSVGVALVSAIIITTLLHKRVDADRPVRSVLTGFWAEVTAGRPPASVHVEMKVPKRRR